MTEIEVATMLDMIKDCHQNFIITDSTIKTWHMLFADYECDPIMASARKYLRTNEYCPVPASILKIYDEAKAKLDKSVGENIYELVGILTFMLGKSDVFTEVDLYKAWIKTVPEMHRMGISKRMIAKLKQYGNDHVGEKFDFEKWLNENKEMGDKY